MLPQSVMLRLPLTPSPFPYSCSCAFSSPVSGAPYRNTPSSCSRQPHSQVDESGLTRTYVYYLYQLHRTSIPNSQTSLTTMAASVLTTKPVLAPPPTDGTSTHKILVLPGDHVGPEVMMEALKVLSVIEDCTGITFEATHD